MRYDSAARLAHLESLHRIKSAAARDAQRARNDLATAATAARRDADEAEAEVEAERKRRFAYIGDRIAERMKDDPQGESLSTKAARLRARAKELDAALAPADAHAAATRDAATDAGRVLAAARDFARANGLPLPVTVAMPGADPLAGLPAQAVAR